MNDTALNLRLRKCHVNSFMKACQTVHTEHINVLDTAIPKIVHYGQPKSSLSFSPIQTFKIYLRAHGKDIVLTTLVPRAFWGCRRQICCIHRNLHRLSILFRSLKLILSGTIPSVLSWGLMAYLLLSSGLKPHNKNDQDCS